MNYIGSKNKLSNFIKDSIYNVVGNDLSEKIFCDIFAGTGIIGKIFKKEVKQVICNDIEYYSYVLIRNYIGNNRHLDYQKYIEELNGLKLHEGMIYKNYCMGSGSGRQYFNDENGKIIDTIRNKIEEWYNKKEIDSDLYYFLLASLLESADKVANTASVYGAFLKKIKKTADKKMILKPAIYEVTDSSHRVFNIDSNVLINNIEGDILYLDPPYNARQYGANYHILNTIAKYDDFIPRGKTGLREYYKSAYCRKNEVADSFEYLIKNANFKYIFLSYNNEGLLVQNRIQEIMKKFGKYDFLTKKYQRFKADNNRKHKAENTIEFLHVLEKK